MAKSNLRFPSLFVFVLAGLLVSNRTMSGAPLLPDIIMEAHNVAQTTNSTTGVKELRFSTWTINVGAGPLELRATDTHPDGSQDVNQRIYDSDGVSFTDTYAGTFAVVSGRLRFTDSADYFLKEVTANNGVGGIVAATEKVSYCIVDSGKYTTSPPNTPANAHYTTCGPVMG